jgi:hypothetical protein
MKRRPIVRASGNQELYMEIVMVGLEILRRALCRGGPYLFVEIVMPGGTLLALLIYLYRRRAMKNEFR